MASPAQSLHRHSPRSSRPIRSSRTRVRTYHEDSSSEDPNLEPDSDEQARRLSLSLRPRDSHRVPVSYREDSSDGDLDGGADATDDPDVILPTGMPTRFEYPFPEPATQGPRPRPSQRRTVKTRSQTQRTHRPSGKKRLELGRPLNKRRKVDQEEPVFVGSGVIPAWQSLPYHILFDIFTRASYPLVDEMVASRHSSVQWLLKVALLCRAFQEPALAALYRCPPLMSATQSHGLLSLLSKPQESLSTNYVNKIQELDIEVELLLLYKGGPALGYFDLSKLLEKTPQVKRLRLYHRKDREIGHPPWQISQSRWTYPEPLFTAIKSSSIRLRSWDWNGRFMEAEQLLRFMMATHLDHAFSGLQELKLLHIPAAESEDDDEREVVLATALKELPQLHHLNFFECSIVNEHLLPNLPPRLASLTINNCVNVTSMNLSAFLTTHGRNMRELTLCHNRHLSLSFLVGLAHSCPQLQKFKVDISMHDLSSYHDVEPHFNDLLGRSEIPSWPSTLQDLEMQQLRKWDGQTAEVFFTSLIDAAPDMRDLRRLVISAILKIGWRDRASFREKWIGRLNKVFLRRSAPPDPNLRTIPRGEPLDLFADGASVDETTTQGDASVSGPSTPSKRKSARLAQRKFSEAEDDSEPTPSSRLSAGDDEYPSLLPAQGMCDVVMVRIDNQRPTDTQYNEADFLDDELSGDEDWDGRDIDAGDGSHAW